MSQRSEEYSINLMPHFSMSPDIKIMLLIEVAAFVLLLVFPGLARYGCVSWVLPWTWLTNVLVISSFMLLVMVITGTLFLVNTVDKTLKTAFFWLFLLGHIVIFSLLGALIMKQGGAYPELLVLPAAGAVWHLSRDEEWQFLFFPAKARLLLAIFMLLYFLPMVLAGAWLSIFFDFAAFCSGCWTMRGLEKITVGVAQKNNKAHFIELE